MNCAQDKFIKPMTMLEHPANQRIVFTIYKNFELKNAFFLKIELHYEFEVLNTKKKTIFLNTKF